MPRRRMLLGAVVVAGTVFGALSLSGAGEVLQSVTTFVHGEILQIDGPYYTIREQSGREIRVHVDGTTTKADESFSVGDKIAADVTPRGHAGLMIKESR